MPPSLPDFHRYILGDFPTPEERNFYDAYLSRGVRGFLGEPARSSFRQTMILAISQVYPEDRKIESVLDTVIMVPQAHLDWVLSEVEELAKDSIGRFLGDEHSARFLATCLGKMNILCPRSPKAWKEMRRRSNGRWVVFGFQAEEVPEGVKNLLLTPP